MVSIAVYLLTLLVVNNVVGHGIKRKIGSTRSIRLLFYLDAKTTNIVPLGFLQAKRGAVPAGSAGRDSQGNCQVRENDALARNLDDPDQSLARYGGEIAYVGATRYYFIRAEPLGTDSRMW